MSNEVYKIVWLDIVRPNDTWVFEEEARDLKPARIETIGWVLENKKDFIIFYSSRGDDRQLGDINCIPKSVILELKQIPK